MDSKSIKSRRFLEYWTVLIAILGMGSMYFQILRMPLMAVMMVSTSIFLLLRGGVIRRKNIFVYFLISVVFFISTIVSASYGFRMNDLIIWIINAVFLVVMQSNMSFESFKSKYVILIVIEAAISLICFLWADVLGNSLPLLQTNYNATHAVYLTPYFTLGYEEIPIFHRNAGMFNEPGAHQIFLNFALLYLLSDEENIGLKRSCYNISIIILIIAILTTRSTTGYICLGIVLVASATRRKSLRCSNHKYRILVVVVALFLLIIIENNTGVISDKIAGRETGQGSFNTRYNDSYYGYYIAFERPFLGHGMFMEDQEGLMSKYGIVSISNGMASFAIRAGILLTCVWLITMFLRIRKRLPYNILTFILYVLCVNSEGMFLNILFLIFLTPWCECSENHNEHCIASKSEMHKCTPNGLITCPK